MLWVKRDSKDHWRVWKTTHALLHEYISTTIYIIYDVGYTWTHFQLCITNYLPIYWQFYFSSDHYLLLVFSCYLKIFHGKITLKGILWNICAKELSNLYGFLNITSACIYFDFLLFSSIFQCIFCIFLC